MEILLKLGANLNSADQYDDSPLHLAAEFNHKECVKLLLLKIEIDFTKKNGYGETAVDVAKKKGFTEIISMLEDPERVRYNHVEGLVPFHSR